MDKETQYLRSLGITVGTQDSLIHTTKDQQADLINKGIVRDEQVGRQGLDTARDRLGATISVNNHISKAMKSYGSEGLKDMLGESHHSDAKKMDEEQDEVVEVDSVHAADEEENMAVHLGKKVRTAAGQLSSPIKDVPRKAPPGAIKRSMPELTREELLIKALDGIGKGEGSLDMGEAPLDKNAYCAPKAMKAKKGALVQWAKEEESEPDHKPVKKSENPLDEVFDSLIVTVADPHKPEAIAAVHENSDFGSLRPRAEAPPVIPFLKSAGPGGYLFDFGNLTGNPLADNATALLQRHADPVQNQIATDQRTGYNRALNNFVTKGHTEGQGTSGINHGWAEQMNKPMDQQVREAHEAGQLNGSAPSSVNKFNAIEGTVNGEVVKASSETDAAVLEMFKAEMAAQGEIGMVADVRNGGAVSVTIDAKTGQAI